MLEKWWPQCGKERHIHHDLFQKAHKNQMDNLTYQRFDKVSSVVSSCAGTSRTSSRPPPTHGAVRQASGWWTPNTRYSASYRRVWAVVVILAHVFTARHALLHSDSQPDPSEKQKQNIFSQIDFLNNNNNNKKWLENFLITSSFCIIN